ncbi:MAG TPA: EF-hand domain-containing protein, partial [Candidatus Poseidoniaceae archaeon]|nr:EF-hand domain-containing protein [Candidatus Poseidoniaceae archaeon]
FWFSFLFSIGVGFSMWYLRTIGDKDYNQLIWIFLFPVLTLIYWLVFNSNTGQLESRHRLTISATNISLQAKFLGIIPLNTKIWNLDDFIDIDADENGRLTIFIGDRRYSMKMHRREAEWFVGEVATQMEQLMVDKINEARKSMNLELKEAFKKFDKNNDGNLSTEELEAAIDAFGIGLSKLQMKVLMRDIDKDSDGKIDYNEFVDRFSSKIRSKESTEEE